MTYGLDTGYLVAAEVSEHVLHSSAKNKLAALISSGNDLALALQVLAEFMHVVTDPRRFQSPLTVIAAAGVADQWWNAREVSQVFPNSGTTRQFLDWMTQHLLGRKRLLDTLLAATYLASWRDFAANHKSCRFHCVW
jgi:predicted nucleic acid-binding protein